MFLDEKLLKIRQIKGKQGAQRKSLLFDMLLEKIKICCRRYLNKNGRLAKEIEGTREQLEFVKRIKQGKITGFEA